MLWKRNKGMDMKPSEHRARIAQEVTALLGLDGTDPWLPRALLWQAANGEESVALDLGQALGPQKAARLLEIVRTADRPEFRRAGVITATRESVLLLEDLWIDEDASEDARQMLDAPMALGLLAMVEEDVVLLFADLAGFAEDREELRAAIGYKEGDEAWARGPGGPLLVTSTTNDRVAGDRAPASAGPSDPAPTMPGAMAAKPGAGQAQINPFAAFSAARP